MKREQAVALIRETFTAVFDKPRFLHFIKNLLNEIDEEKAYTCNKQYVKDAFKDYVDRYERLGTYTAPEGDKLDVYVVHLSESPKLERARTALRNFVADVLKTRDEKDAALVAFVSPKPDRQWRFSYVKMEYATVEKTSGKVSVEARLTPARRFSYRVGEGESCHTAQSRFVELLQDTHVNPGLDRLEEAFSVETVTREFFERYKALFLDVKDALDELTRKDKVIRGELAEKKIDPADFAKKLLGQIVFLYFLQKKGWLGVERGKPWGSGPGDFMRRLAQGKFRKYDNFFNDVLEPLFYDTLATDRGHEAWCKTFASRIPFLNGGLFEPIGDYDWRKTDIVISNRLFTNDDPVEEGVTGSGILDVFDRYNFTVNEAEPLEKEVAIDPEMLGKVFENLLDVKERKSKGSYYTPREIVHYMCQECLINYLDTTVNHPEHLLPPAVSAAPATRELVPRIDIETLIHFGDQALDFETARKKGTSSYAHHLPKSVQEQARLLDEKLAAITVCDPAIGSGAFPVGMMQEIVRARSALTPYFNDIKDRTLYDFKRQAIQHSLYGVDIDPGAVDIAKLRLWLSLVVDEEDVQQIKPLPNLDYKIITANSLDRYDAGDAFLNRSTLQELERLKSQVFDVTDFKAKAKLKTQIDKLIGRITLDREYFDFSILFSEVFQASRRGFDVVIGNPPYVRQEGIKALKPKLKQQYACYSGTADLLVYFYEQAWNILRPGGTHAFIASNKWLRSQYGEKLREFLAAKAKVLRIIDFGDAPVFEVIAYPCVTVLQKTGEVAGHVAQALTWKPGPPLESFARVVRDSALDLPQVELKADGWRLESSDVLRLLEKLRRAGKPLGEYVNGRFYRGILTGLNEAFVVDRVTRDRLIREHPSSAEVLKPFLRGRDVKRWRAEFAEQYLIRLESSENKEHPWSGKPEKEAEKVFARVYPAIHAHFHAFRHAKLDAPDPRGCRNMFEKLLKRDDQGKYYWELRSCIYWQEFEKPKVIYPDIYEHQSFAWDSTGFYAVNTCYFIPTEEKWLTGLLNSRLIEWFYCRISNKVRGDYLRAFSDVMKTIPIPFASIEIQQKLSKMVDSVVAELRRDSDVQVCKCECQIDNVVYELFGLAANEIALIENSVE